MFKFIVSLGRPSHNLWFASWKFRCDVCGKFMAFKKTRNDMHKHCQKEYYDELAEAERYTREQDALAEASPLDTQHYFALKQRGYI